MHTRFCSSHSLFCLRKLSVSVLRSNSTPITFFGAHQYPFRQIKRPFATGKKDYYELLGISKNATQDDIKKAYRKAAKQYHPDLNKGNKEYEKKFAEISAAYDVLGNEEKRRSYDQFGSEEPMMGGGGGGYGYGDMPPIDLNDLFENFFRGSQQVRTPHGRDVMVNLRLSFMEAIKGCEKEVKYTANQKCETCTGTGQKAGTKAATCKTCNGSGFVRTSRGPFQVQDECGSCHGKGSINTDPCPSCKGQAVTPKTINSKIKIPPGVSDGDTVRSPGGGDASRDVRGRPGDLLIGIEVQPHSVFERIGFNVHVYVPLSLSQALLGGYIKVPTLKGDVEVQIPQGKPVEMRVMKGGGIKNPENQALVGDQYIHFEIQLPKTLTARQKELMEEFRKEEPAVPPVSSKSSYQKSNAKSAPGSGWFDRIKNFMGES